MQIGESAPAPMFRLVAQPNDWEKTVCAATRRADSGNLRSELFRAFWNPWLARIQADRPGWSRSTRPPGEAWFNTAAGASGANFQTIFTRRGLSGELPFQHPDADINTAHFNHLSTRKGEIDATYGRPLDYQEMPGKKATRIADYLVDAKIENEEAWPEYLVWLLDRQSRLRAAVAHVGGLIRPGAAVTPDDETE